MSLLSVAQILSARDLKTHDEPVPEWPNEDGTPGILRFRKLSAGESIRMSEITGARPDDSLYVIIAMSLDGDNGQRLFEMKTDEDVQRAIDVLSSKDMTVLNRLQHVAFAVNKVRVPTPEQPELPNASGEAPSGASPSN